MKTINKIALTQLGFALGGFIGYSLFVNDIKIVVINHVILTIGYLLGLSQVRKQIKY